MAITLDAISLPEDLIWFDEYGWSPVTQIIEKSLTGSLIIQEATQSKGRLITLMGSPDSTWINRATLELLRAKADIPDLTMSLDFNDTLFSVMFNRAGNKSPFEVREIFELADPQSDHIYSITLRFIEV